MSPTDVDVVSSLPVSEEDEEELSREELLGMLDAVRAIARASVDTDIGSVLEGVLRVAATATESDRAGLFMIDEGGETMSLVGGYPQDDHLARHYRQVRVSNLKHAAGLRSSVAIPSTEFGAAGAEATAGGLKQGAIIPISLHGKAVGTLNLGRSADRVYGAREMHLGEILGELLVVHVENARLYADARRGMEETRMLLDASRVIAASLELEVRLDASAEVLSRMLDATNASVMLLSEDGAALEGASSSKGDASEEARELRLPLVPTSPMARAIRTLRTVVVDASSSTEERAHLGEAFEHRAIVAIPLVSQGAPIGVVHIDDERAHRIWSRAEVTRAELIAQSVAVGVSNARLFTEVRSRSIELQRAQRELIKRERLAAIGELAAIMAHEVRNPLAVLFNSLSALEKRLPGKGETATLLRIMGEEGRRLERLVRELLDFARPLTPSFESESLRAILESAALAASRELGSPEMGVRIAVSANLPSIRLDPSMIRRALVNVVVNALQAAGMEGVVSVTATLERGARGELGGGEVVRIEISDNGPGIPAEVAVRVFEPFFTTKAMGTGLGLAVVRSIVESHGGVIHLSSTEGAGTTVVIRLPVGGHDWNDGPPLSARPSL